MDMKSGKREFGWELEWLCNSEPPLSSGRAYVYECFDLEYLFIGRIYDDNPIEQHARCEFVNSAETRETEGKAFIKPFSDKEEELESKNRRLMVERWSLRLKDMREELESMKRLILAESEERAENAFTTSFSDDREERKVKRQNLFDDIYAEERVKGEAQNQRKSSSLHSKHDSDSYRHLVGRCIWGGNEQSQTDMIEELRLKRLRALKGQDVEPMLLLSGAGKSSFFFNSLYSDLTRIEKSYSTSEREKGEAQNHRRNTGLHSIGGSDSYSNLERLSYWVGNGGLGGQCESFWESPWQSKGIYESGTKNDSYEEDSESGGSDGQGELCWKHPQVKSPDVVTSESGTNKDLYEEDAEAEIREVEQLLMCKVCLDKDSCIVFFPCRHMATCESCESFLQRCPVCRSQINKAVRINEY